jgi:pimeloyl-ACP methyl ester carboxylesterase
VVPPKRERSAARTVHHVHVDLEQRHRQTARGDARERLLATMPVSERRLQLAGISTAVLEGGDGPPVVLLHGPGAIAAEWMRVIPDLATTHRVVAPDLPGHGASEVTDGGLDADRVLAWLGELIERTCTARPALVGHILGGAIAARYASSRSDRLSGLVLVNPLGLARFWPPPTFAFALIRHVTHPTERSFDRLWRQCAADAVGLRAQMGEHWDALESYVLDRARTPSVKSAMRALMKELGVPAIPERDLARINTPTTLIWGRYDRVLRLRIGEAASARYGWPLHVIENAGNEPNLEQPESFLETLRPALTP